MSKKRDATHKLNRSRCQKFLVAPKISPHEPKFPPQRSDRRHKQNCTMKLLQAMFVVRSAASQGHLEGRSPERKQQQNHAVQARLCSVTMRLEQKKGLMVASEIGDVGFPIAKRSVT